MDKFLIHGPTPLRGTLRVSGSKNAALPLMAAALLSDEPSRIGNTPRLQDIRTFRGVIEGTGCGCAFDEQANELRLDPSGFHSAVAPYDLVRKMRASFYMLGALAGRCGEAKVSLPGGCAWGPRPVDLHVKGLQAMGYSLRQEGGYILLNGPRILPPASFTLEPSSVGATVNLLLASVTRSEQFTIRNAALEPDVEQLCRALVSMGADIEGIGTSTLKVRRVDSLRGLDVDNAPDRIEAGTFLIAGAMHPESDVTVEGFRLADMGVFMDRLQQTGTELERLDRGAGAAGGDSGTAAGATDAVRVRPPRSIRPVSLQAAIHPGFPTDLQAQWATLMCLADGPSVVTDTVYADRFSYVPELTRLGADIRVDGPSVRIRGPVELSGASVMGTDLRASVSLVMAAMAASGDSEVLRVYHLDRGYEELEAKLNAVGAAIERTGA